MIRKNTDFHIMIKQIPFFSFHNSYYLIQFHKNEEAKRFVQVRGNKIKLLLSEKCIYKEKKTLQERDLVIAAIYLVQAIEHIYD